MGRPNSRALPTAVPSSRRSALLLATLASLSGCRLADAFRSDQGWWRGREEALQRPALLPPDRDHCVRGTVLRDELLASPEPGAQVAFEREGDELYVTHSDAAGRFSWCNVGRLERLKPPTRLGVRISAEGLVAGTYSFVWTGEAEPPVLFFKLQKADSEARPLQAGSGRSWQTAIRHGE